MPRPSPLLALTFAAIAPLTLALASCSDADRPSPALPRGAPALAALTVGPRPLSPPFSPDVHDYAIACSAGVNPLIFTARAAPGAVASYRAPIAREVRDDAPIFAMIPEDSAIVVDVAGGDGATAEYWIRCLPGDFPALQITRRHSSAPGWYLLGNPSFGAGEAGYVMALDDRGTPVWYRRVGDGAGLLTLVGEQTLAYSPIFGFAFGVAPGRSFQVEDLAAGTLKNVGLADFATDQHEFAVAPNGNYLLLTYPAKGGYDLRSLGLPETVIADCRVEELGPDGRLVWSWDASDHVDVLTESMVPLPVEVNGVAERDAFHCNSIDPQPNGDLLLSVRHANALLMISRATGKVLWKLGGTPVNKDGAKHVRVLDDPEGAFLMQHDARVLPDGHVTLFDNHSAEDAPARAMELAVDLEAGTARIVWQQTAPPPLRRSLAMGGFRVLPTGEREIAWGVLDDEAPALALTEVDLAGEVLFEIALTRGGRAFRPYKVARDRLDVALLRRSAGRSKR